MTIQNDLTILSLFLEQKVANFNSSKDNQESLQNRIRSMYKNLEDLNF